MGFSTSGAVAVILIGVLIAVSAVVPTLFEVTAATGDAFSGQNEQFRDQQNTAITVESFTYDSDADVSTVRVTNDGATALSVAETDVVVNGAYYHVEGNDDRTAVIRDGEERPDSDVWTPGTVLEITIDNADLEAEYEVTGDGDSVRITTENGIADRLEVGGGGS
ncbi:flagellin [Halobiforma lacisalsi AJ5]|uniref:Flagellin n=1 Tax=Natronobacterium lacisalsi AJ5 TaxID=358396 RepID=M0LXY5_NATLA|nr:flagellin [Halobiforma lacisalsi]APW97389.1 flagellin [Halobiforma lacisalsi AJ5]EMA38316.1 flagellin [Halobiforma lacisalsi AJ5]